MARFIISFLVVFLVLGICLLCGFSILEALIIFVLGVFSLGFLGWIIQGFRPNLLRCILFWWISKLFGKPELLFPR
ncbi:MAG: hypothetical protein JXB23_08005 [Candidatus Aminicenantes bacterium]|nr:hypothetical protein [Candidatus Aminicenantes bacterium]